MKTTLKKLRLIIDAPEFMEPWLDRFYEATEIAMAPVLEQEWKPIEYFHHKFSMGQKAVERSYKRGVLEKDANTHYRMADFHTRYDIWSTLEGFKDLPDDIRNQLNEWEFEHYCQTHAAEVEQVRRTKNPDAVDGAPHYLLLEETLQIIDSVERIYLWPCNCRSMIHACNKPVYTCLRFENNRGIGFEISREKAREIVLDANKKGLMQSGEFGKDSNGKRTGAICNCCADCCFPHLLSREKKVEKIWPFSRYGTRYNEETCTLCGLCSKRCPFDAFVFQKKTKEKPASLSLLPNLCRGCGLCATACPAGAIAMEPLNVVLLSDN